MTKDEAAIEWFRVAGHEDLADGRVKTVTAGVKFLALSHFDGQYAAMDNHCPHQGGPLGEGSIERGVEGKCWLRCPWHGWDFDPLTGKSPGGHEDAGQTTYPVDVRDDGIYVGVEAEPEAPRTVSDVMAETMVNWGVSYVFGMVGHSNLGLADALRRQEAKGKLSYIGIRHEGAASFACSGYAKLTGKPAACFTIAGPGATNLITGLYDAKVDRAPVLALAGQVNTQVMGPGAFQEVDLHAAFAPVSNFNHVVLHNSNHAELMSLALKKAMTARDVSTLIFPDEVQVIEAPDAPAQDPSGRVFDGRIRPPADILDKACDALAAAKRPMIIVGYGARERMDEVVALADRLNAPVVTTFKAKGQISDRHALAAGVLGRSGTPIASWFMNEADLLVVFGASFSDHTGIEKKKPIIQVDFDPDHLAKGHDIAYPIYGEIGVTAEAIIEALEGRTLAAQDQRAELTERLAIWRREKERRESEDLGDGLSAAALFAALTDTVPENAVIAVDVGNNTYSFGRYFEVTGQRVLMSGYLGSIGFAFPAAMGAWAATQAEEGYRGRPVVSVSGDGGFGQYMGEFNTAVKYGMNITHILMNNSELGKITKEQQAVEYRVWQTELSNPSFAAYAKLCGGQGWKVTKREQLKDAIEAALAYDGPAIVEVITDTTLL